MLMFTGASIGTTRDEFDQIMVTDVIHKARSSQRHPSGHSRAGPPDTATVRVEAYRTAAAVPVTGTRWSAPTRSR